jgi:hypothetical protein
MDLLNLLKIILEMDITDSSKDNLLNFYISKSKNAIKNYCVLTEDEYLAANLNNPTAELAMFFYKNKKNSGLKNKSEGSRSFSYTESAIPTDIKETLPVPKVKLH